MSLAIDGFAVLRSIGTHAAAFGDVAAEARRTAQRLVAKQIMIAATDLGALRNVYIAVGEADFGLVLDGMSDADIRCGLLTIDPHRPGIATASGTWCRSRFRALAGGTAEPAPKPASAVAARSRSVRAPGQSKAAATRARPERLHSAAMVAVRRKKK
ncbi:MAG: hypothetical protein HXX10_05095 [Rhodoplanes sp.]|uniref:hypothetical protein n=1 Tax=Rhodoplanes sp. TaxID=1968906 RepID=UPI0017987E05|nr:hypothetical protein [Rhodoplanes sp.]NVO13394.1 hypothetical protein [Rhodoplanes sp.]